MEKAQKHNNPKYNYNVMWQEKILKYKIPIFYIFTHLPRAFHSHLVFPPHPLKSKPLIHAALLMLHFHIKADKMHWQENYCHSNELSINFATLADAAIVLKCMSVVWLLTVVMQKLWLCFYYCGLCTQFILHILSVTGN